MSSKPATDDIAIRKALTFEDYHACQEAQRRAWGIMTDGYIVPVATMVGAQLHGGLVLGAFLPSGEAVGLSFAFLGRLEARLCLYSQLTGVVPEYQGLGIGARLKQSQWEYARAEGLELLAWAFDPLQATNAHFNLRKLGATAGRYLEDMYGPRADQMNAGTPTDRLVVSWETQPSPRRAFSPAAIDSLPPVIPVSTGPDGLLTATGVAIDLQAPMLLLEIPAEINQVREQNPARAAQWRLAVRAAFQHYLGMQYRAVDFVQRDEAGRRRCFYLLTKADTR